MEGQMLVSEYGTINDKGKLCLYNQEFFIKRVSSFPECNIEIKVFKREGSFTHQFRKYYFSVLVPELQRAFLYYGNEWSKSDVDYFMREKFLFKEWFDEETGEWKKEPHRLSDAESEVTFEMFKNYVEACIRFAIKVLNWAVPYPNEKLDVKDYTDDQVLSLSRR